MILKRLSLINFKNISETQLNFEAGINAMVGDNGAGKTNIIDAIYYLSMCKSMLTMTDGQSVKHGEDFFVVDGNYLSDAQRSDSVVCTFSKQRSHTKVLKRNGKEYERLSDHVGMIPVVVVSPQDYALITDSAEERRRFINAFLSQMSREYMQALIRYNALLQQRNRSLKMVGDGSMLQIYDEQMTEYANTIYKHRCDVVKELAPLVERFYSALSGDREQVEIGYSSQLHECNYMELMERSRGRDFSNEYTTSGVHRDDINFTIGGYPLRKYGSQGQQKSFLIALKLAQYILVCQTVGERPILLLDDLFDKLDAGRVEQLIGIVSGEEFGQIFITDCNRTRIERILSKGDTPFRLFEVESGKIPQTPKTE